MLNASASSMQEVSVCYLPGRIVLSVLCGYKPCSEREREGEGELGETVMGRKGRERNNLPLGQLIHDRAIALAIWTRAAHVESCQGRRGSIYIHAHYSSSCTVVKQKIKSVCLWAVDQAQVLTIFPFLPIFALFWSQKVYFSTLVDLARPYNSF